MGADQQRLPKGGHIAILLRGQAFRCGNRSDPTNAQLEATDSLMSKIVFPLEQNSNNVEFFVSHNKCREFESELLPKFGERIAAISEFDSPDQGTNMRFSLDKFKSKVGGLENIAKKYDLVMIIRHDQIWHQWLYQWPTANFDKFNFFSQCEPDRLEFGRGGPPANCVNDPFHMMPGSMFSAFDSVAGNAGGKGCFNKSFKHGCGHGCYPDMETLIGAENITFITNWVPRHSVGESNDVSSFTCKR